MELRFKSRKSNDCYHILVMNLRILKINPKRYRIRLSLMIVISTLKLIVVIIIMIKIIIIMVMIKIIIIMVIIKIIMVIIIIHIIMIMMR